jgi:hypothetical protein
MSRFGTQRPKLIKALLEAFSSDDVILLASLLGGRIDDIAPRPATRPDQIVKLVEWAEQQRCEERLLQEATELNPTNDELAAVASLVLEQLLTTRPWYQSPHPVQTCIVGSDQAFVGRLQLRGNLDKLMLPNNWTTLLVDGEPRSGRSFTLELLAFVLGLDPDTRIVHIDLKDATRDLAPVDLARRFALQMTLDDTGLPPQDAQAVKWNEELRDWVIGRVESSGKTCWLVIDAIDRVHPSDATMDLIWKLAAAARTRPRLRVVLLACSEHPPSSVRALREDIQPINRGEVEAFFTLFLQHCGVPPNAQMVLTATDQALAAVPADGDDRLERLQEEIVRVAKTIVGEPS